MTSQPIAPMPSFTGILVPVGNANPMQLIEELRLRSNGVTTSTKALMLTLVGGASFGMAEEWASRASRAARVAYAITAQTSADAYIVERFESGTGVRTIAFNRDEDDPWTLTGTAGAWEADLLFAMNEEDFIAYLSDDETYSEGDLELSRRAHAAHTLNELARRPPLLAASLWDWLGQHGVNPERPNVAEPKRGVFARWFTRP